MRLSRKAKHKKKSTNKALKSIPIVSASLVLSLTGVLDHASVQAATVDDLRDLAGQPRIDSQYTPELQRQIESEYKKIEDYNRLARLLRSNQSIDVMSKVDLERSQLTKTINAGKTNLIDSFTSGAPVNTVLTAKTTLGSLEYIKSQLKQEGDQIILKPKQNVWKAKYQAMQAVLKRVSAYTDLGVVGSELESPARDSLYIVKPFGFSTNPRTGELENNTGLDVYAPAGTEVLSLWHGEVTAAGWTALGGKTVEIKHPDGVTSLYSHLNRVDVKVGDQVQQYSVIGTVGKSGGVADPQLHFEVALDGKRTNPILFFGVKGLRAYSEYLNNHNDTVSPEQRMVLAKIKSRPNEGLVVSSPVEVTSSDTPSAPPKPSSRVADADNPTKLFTSLEGSSSEGMEFTNPNLPSESSLSYQLGQINKK